MADRYRVKVVCIGNEEEINALLHAMMRAYGAIDDEDEDGPRPRRQDMEAHLHQLAHREGGREDGFLYEMICCRPFGTLEIADARMSVAQTHAGLWAAVFDYHTQNRFMVEDWLRLHLNAGSPPMLCQYAAKRFEADKGCALISNGKVMDSWDTVAETWFYLSESYLSYYPPDEAVEKLKKLRQVLTEEEYDLSVSELITASMDNLTQMAATVADEAALTQALTQAKEARDFGMLLSLQLRIAENLLWETERNKKWLACLESLRQAWEKSGAEG